MKKIRERSEILSLCKEVISSLEENYRIEITRDSLIFTPNNGFKSLCYREEEKKDIAIKLSKILGATPNKIFLDDYSGIIWGIQNIELFESDFEKIKKFKERSEKIKIL